MPDVSDVSNQIVSIISQALYGDTAFYVPGKAAATPAGYVCRIGRGFPLPDQLNHDLASSITTVTVTPIPGMSRDTSRYPIQALPVSSVPITFTASTSGNTVTFGGIPTAGQVVGIGIGHHGYAYRMQNSDTVQSVTAAFAAMMPNVSVSNSTLSLSTNLFTANVVSDQNTITEIRRQTTVFNIGVWTYDPIVRDTISSTIDVAMASQRSIRFSDGSSSNIPVYAGSYESDKSERADLWRRDLRYTIEYPTTLSSTLPTAIFLGGTLPGNIIWGTS